MNAGSVSKIARDSVPPPFRLGNHPADSADPYAAARNVDFAVEIPSRPINSPSSSAIA
jgi:hypothetical protein